MATKFFKNFPEISYPIDNQIIKIKDYFKKARIDDSSLDQIVEYTFYELEEGDRPDVVASKLYGNSELNWTFFLVNDISNYYEWYKWPSVFENYIEEKYSGFVLVAQNTSDIITPTNKFLMGETVRTTTGFGNIKCVEPTFKRIAVDNVTGVFKSSQSLTGAISEKEFSIYEVQEHRDATAYFTDGKKRSTVSTNGWTKVSYYDMETEINESRRFIKVIKPSRIKSVVNQFEKVMS